MQYGASTDLNASFESPKYRAKKCSPIHAARSLPLLARLCWGFIASSTDSSRGPVHHTTLLKAEVLNGFSLVRLANKTNELNSTMASAVGPQLEGIIDQFSPLESSTSPTGAFGTAANNVTAHFFVAMVKLSPWYILDAFCYVRSNTLFRLLSKMMIILTQKDAIKLIGPFFDGLPPRGAI